MILILCSSHRHIYPEPLRILYRPLITRIRMPHNARAGIVSKHSLQPPLRFLRSIGYNHHAGVDGQSYPHAAAVMDADPACPADGIEQCVENGPVGDRIAAV